MGRKIYASNDRLLLAEYLCDTDAEANYSEAALPDCADTPGLSEYVLFL